MGGRNSYESPLSGHEDNGILISLSLVRCMPKGKKDIIKAHAEAHSESVNGFINRAIDEAIERDESAPAASEGQGEG